MLLGNLAQWEGFALAGAREQDVDLAFFSLVRIEQTVKVVEFAASPPDASYVQPINLTASSSCSLASDP